MVENIALKVENIEKKYLTFNKPVDRLLQRFYMNKKILYREFLALKDISFEVKVGETMGIVGQNGSGKSTLLQIIAGTLMPTSGTVEVNGRIAALLELGAGFNPEFNGIDNARLNASIMGISQDEFNNYLPEIIEFSGLGDFIYQPVKTYSSGMYVRLAFSVSVSLRPSILIIDEALGVGDARFQRKCFRKLEQLKENGVTILFVSHALDSIINHCDRAIFINQGVIQDIGRPKQVVTNYLDTVFKAEQAETKQKVKSNIISAASEVAESKQPNQSIDSHSGLMFDINEDNCKLRPTYNIQEHRWGSGDAKIVDYKFECNDKEIRYTLQQGDIVKLSVAIVFIKKTNAPIYAMTVKTTDGTVVYATNTRRQKISIDEKNGNDKVVVEFEFKVNLIASNYFISLGVAFNDEEKDHIPLDRRYDLIHLKVEDNGHAFGLAMLACDIQENKL